MAKPLASTDVEIIDHRDDSGKRRTWQTLTPLGREDAIQALCFKRGRRYAHCTFENFQTKDYRGAAEVRTALEEYWFGLPDDLNGRGGGVVMYGPPGVGKDHLLMALMKKSIAQYGVEILWEEGAELFATIKQAIGEKNVENVIRQFIRAPILAISDPAPPTDSMSQWDTAVFARIIDRRYCACRPTWITTNVANRQDACERLGAAVLDRLAHDSVQLRCDWASYRTR